MPTAAMVATDVDMDPMEAMAAAMEAMVATAATDVMAGLLRPSPRLTVMVDIVVTDVDMEVMEATAAAMALMAVTTVKCKPKVFHIIQTANLYKELSFFSQVQAQAI